MPDEQRRVLQRINRLRQAPRPGSHKARRRFSGQRWTAVCPIALAFAWGWTGLLMLNWVPSSIE